MNLFYNVQDEEQQKLYCELLEVTGSLSNLFAENTAPFIYYRAMENIFCKAFLANNLSRSDISADAGKNGVGIGLKTFLQQNGRTFQKVAEFNKGACNFDGLSNLELVKKVSQMRNERITTTMSICEFNSMIYHLLTRDDGKMMLFEEPMDYVNLNKIKLHKSRSNNAIIFTDGLHEYKFDKSKSTLFKRFYTTNEKLIFEFDVEILDDPFDFLLKTKQAVNDLDSEYPATKSDLSDALYTDKNKEVIDYIVLPLYSTRDNLVPERSGLNQWNARGRKRDPNEVYISVPAWIHKDKFEFFKELYNEEDHKTESFMVQLPNQKQLSMKIAQESGKALMSNPNKALGIWILRDILKLSPGVLVTKEMLDTIGIDSVKLSKLRDGTFALDFLKSGSYAQFEEDYKS